MMGNMVRIIAVLALVNALGDGGRLLGVWSGNADPFEIFGMAGFSALGVFAIARLFAAVGMWIVSNWGAPLLLGTTFIELVFLVFGIVPLDVGIIGFGVRLVQLAGVILILWVNFSNWRRGIHD
jgi:hypothetical protein